MRVLVLVALVLLSAALVTGATRIRLGGSQSLIESRVNYCACCFRTGLSLCCDRCLREPTPRRPTRHLFYHHTQKRLPPLVTPADTVVLRLASPGRLMVLLSGSRHPPLQWAEDCRCCVNVGHTLTRDICCRLCQLLPHQEQPRWWIV